MPTRIVLATRSVGKMAELRPLAETLGIEVLDLEQAGVHQRADEARVETFETFEANAFAKARYYRARLSEAAAVVADDSGLVVDAMDGAPGVYSKRFAGLDGPDEWVSAANRAKLLACLRGERDRRARMVCVVALVDGTRELIARGETAGIVAYEERGLGGFGYDSVFVSSELGRTFAEASLREKSTISHRGRAFAALVAALARDPGHD